ncbi:MAG: DegT/DnrJ/EryC1/StrS family aminotransferase [Candidatus Omnitrophota bacterium]
MEFDGGSNNEVFQQQSGLKIPWAKPMFCGYERKYLLDAFDSGWISAGKYVRVFEESFARLHEDRHAVCVSNCTNALQLALAAFGVGRDDEVIVPGFGFMAAANMVNVLGATCVYADIDKTSWCIDVDLAAKCISPRTKAIVVLHLYGNICDMDALVALAKQKGLILIEDVAQAVFSKYRGRNAGTFGDAAVFSFQSAKTIAMGEGGCVMVAGQALGQKMRLLRDHGMRKGKHYWHDVAGYNFRLTDLQAALGCAQLENLDLILKRKRCVFKSYQKYLANEPGIEFQEFRENIDPIVWAVVVKIDEKIFKASRDDLIKALTKKGIETRPGFYPAGMMPVYCAPQLPVAQEVSMRLISLPSFPALTDEEIRFVCQALKDLRG